ncbi:MAG TPA: hypothetical protein VFT29_19080 [Gemmatimonadaceae bacterium]|nr:hypothetical protein [Gemmatimonadaceae bacterium]
MTNNLDKSNEALSDKDLLDREADQRDEFFRLERFEPFETTYQSLSGSRALMHAWDRWMRTSLTARLRGLLPRARKD